MMNANARNHRRLRRAGRRALWGGLATAALALAATSQADSQTAFSYPSGGKDIAVERFTDGTAAKHPAVILLHGAHGPMAVRSMYETYGWSLAAAGINAYLVHYYDRAGYSSNVPREERRSTYFANYEAWLEAIGDAIGAVAREPDVDPARIGLLGFSRGAYFAVAVASRDARVRAVVEFYGGIPEPEQKKLGRLPPVLILHGDADRTVPVTDGYELERALNASASPYAIKIYPGEGHGFNARLERPAALDALALTLEFLKRNL